MGRDLSICERNAALSLRSVGLVLGMLGIPARIEGEAAARPASGREVFARDRAFLFLRSVASRSATSSGGRYSPPRPVTVAIRSSPLLARRPRA